MLLNYKLLATCCFLLVGTVLGRPQVNEPNVDAEIVDSIAEADSRAAAAASGGGYGPAEVSVEDLDPETVDAVFQVVKQTVPADYAGAEEDETEKVSQQVDAQHAKCSDYTESFGYQCVPYYQCSQGTIITDGAGLIDIRIDGSGVYGTTNILDSKCDGAFDVCCKDPDFVPPPKPKLVHKPKCGRRNDGGLGIRIQGFKEGESQFGEWPHMCAVLHDKPQADGGSKNLYQCGGSLIAPGVILTGAHCVDKFKATPGEVKVRCGEWDTQRQSEPYPHQDRYGKSIKVHPEFKGDSLFNDFALIFLQEEFELNFHIDTICMPRPGETHDYKRCFATGWGKDKFGAEGEYQVVLKEIDLPVVPRDTCQNTLRTTRLGQLFKLHESFICAGGEEGKDTCKGDGGSPLVCPTNNDPTIYEQTGIVAWGIGCGEKQVPGVYASVSQGACWIDYAMTCHYGAPSGDYSSYFGFTEQECNPWRTKALARLSEEEEKAPNPVLKRIFGAVKSQYQECNVAWVKSSDDSSYGVGKEAPSQEVQIASNYNDDSAATIIESLGSDDNSDIVKANEGGDSAGYNEAGDSAGYNEAGDLKDANTAADAGYTADNENLKESDAGYSSGAETHKDSNTSDAGYSEDAENLKESDANYSAGADGGNLKEAETGDGYTADIKEVQEETNQYKK